MTLPAGIEAIAWDVDGTLIDSEPTHLSALEAVCSGHGVDISDLADDAFVGVSLHGVWQAIGPRFPASLGREAWIGETNAHYVRLSGAIPRDGSVRALVERLASMGLRQAAVSNSHRVVVNANLRHLRIDDLLEFSLALDDVAEGKPDPEPYRRAAERLDIVPARMLAVEDSASGVISARAAGCPVIGLAGNAGDLAGTDETVTRLADIPALLARAPMPAG